MHPLERAFLLDKPHGTSGPIGQSRQRFRAIYSLAVHLGASKAYTSFLISHVWAAVIYIARRRGRPRRPNEEDRSSGSREIRKRSEYLLSAFVIDRVFLSTAFLLFRLFPRFSAGPPTNETSNFSLAKNRINIYASEKPA